MQKCPRSPNRICAARSSSRRFLSGRWARRSGSIIQPPELWIGIIGELAGDDRPLPGQEQQFEVLRQVANLIGGQQRAGYVLLAVGDAAFLCIEGAAHGLEHHGFLSEQIGDEAGAVVIVDAEHL